MTRTILVPVDGSTKDGRALAVAADMARLADASLTVVRVLDAQAETALGASRSAVLDAMRQASEAAGLIAPRGVTSEVLDAEDVPTVLLGKAEAVNATAVVMATRAPQVIGRAVQGSVADRVVREATCPVMLVPPGAEFMRGHDLRLRRVLVPVDESRASRAILPHLLALPNAGELDLVLLSVVEPTPGHIKAEEAEIGLNEMATKIRARGATTEVRVVEGDSPASIIAAAVRQDLVELIAMSTRGAGGVERLVFGSVATAVVRASEVPVLLVTPATRAPWGSEAVGR